MSPDNKIIWTADMVCKLIAMRQDGHDYQSCADAIGVDRGVVIPVAQVLGYNKRMNRGSVSARKANEGHFDDRR